MDLYMLKGWVIGLLVFIQIFVAFSTYVSGYKDNLPQNAFFILALIMNFFCILITDAILYDLQGVK